MIKAPGFWVCLCVAIVCATALVMVHQFLKPPAERRAWQVDVDHWAVEFVYGDCLVKEVYRVELRTFEPLYPATSSDKARHRWEAEFARDPKVIDDLSDLPPGAHIILDQVTPPSVESGQ